MYASDFYPVGPQIPSAGVSSVTEPMGVTADAKGWAGMVDPNNPLVWFGAFLLFTVGAAGISGSARLGPARGSVQLGND